MIRRYWQAKSNDPLCISWRIMFSHSRVSSPLPAAMPSMQHRSLPPLFTIATGKTTFFQIVLYIVFCVRNSGCEVSLIFPSGVLLAKVDDWKRAPCEGTCQAAGIPTRKSCGPLRSLLVGSSALPGASVQRLIKKIWCSLSENNNISVSVVTQSSFRHRDRTAFWKTSDDRKGNECEEQDSFSVLVAIDIHRLQ